MYKYRVHHSTYFAIKNLIQGSKESRGRQMLKENNIIFTLER
jgi:hypothetical protein